MIYTVCIMKYWSEGQVTPVTVEDTELICSSHMYYSIHIFITGIESTIMDVIHLGIKFC